MVSSYVSSFIKSSNLRLSIRSDQVSVPFSFSCGALHVVHWGNHLAAVPNFDFYGHSQLLSFYAYDTTHYFVRVR